MKRFRNQPVFFLLLLFITFLWGGQAGGGMGFVVKKGKYLDCQVQNVC